MFCMYMHACTHACVHACIDLCLMLRDRRQPGHLRPHLVDLDPARRCDSIGVAPQVDAGKKPTVNLSLITHMSIHMYIHTFIHMSIHMSMRTPDRARQA